MFPDQNPFLATRTTSSNAHHFITSKTQVKFLPSAIVENPPFFFWHCESTLSPKIVHQIYITYCILYIIYILYITHWFVIMQKNKNKRETSISSLWKTNKLDNFSLNNFSVAWVSYLHQSKLPILCSEKS